MDLNKRFPAALIDHIVMGLIGFVTFALAGLILTSALENYDRRMIQNAPASDYLTYESQIVSDASLGENVPFELCRTLVGGKAVNTSFVRTIRRISAPGDIEYTVPSSQVEDSGCVRLELDALRQPQEPGCYQMVTNVEFVVKSHGQEFYKQTTYVSNVYSYGDVDC